MFGDNVTVSGLPDDLAIGDRIEAGAVVLEVTAPRTPCGTLAKRMGDTLFVQAFRDAERPGAYCRVIRAGTLASNSPASFVPYAGERVGLVEIYRPLIKRGTLDPVRLQAVLALPLAERVRAILRKRRGVPAAARD